MHPAYPLSYLHSQDLLGYTFGFLERHTLARCMRVSQFWCKAAKSNAAWKHIAINNFLIPAPLSNNTTWYQAVREKVLIQQSLRKKTYSKTLLPDILDTLSLLSLTDSKAIYKDETRRIKSWPVRGGKSSSLVHLPKHKARFEVVGDTLYIIVNRVGLHTINLLTQEKKSIALTRFQHIHRNDFIKIAKDTLIIATDTAVVKIWNCHTGARLAKLCNLTSKVAHLLYEPPYLFVATENGEVAGWREGLFLGQEQLQCMHLCFTGTYLITVNSNKMVCLWRVGSEKLDFSKPTASFNTTFRTYLGKNILHPLFALFDSKLFFCPPTAPHTVDFWDMKTNTYASGVVCHKAPLSHMVATTSALYTGSDDGQLHTLTGSSCITASRTIDTCKRSIRKILPLDNQLVLSYGDDQKAIVYNSTTGELLETFDLKGFELKDVHYSQGSILLLSEHNILGSINLLRTNAQSKEG